MDFDLVGRLLLALLFVLALIGLFAWAARRFGLSGRLGPVAGRTRRLHVVEVAPLDAKTRLVLLRRDDVEHLVMLCPSAGVVIESGIRAAAGFAEQLARSDEGAGTAPTRPTENGR